MSREETKYLDKELVSLACPHDGAMKEIEEFVEDHLVKYYRNFREVFPRAIPEARIID